MNAVGPISFIVSWRPVQTRRGEKDARRVMVSCFKAHVSRDGKTRSMDGVEEEEVAC